MHINKLELEQFIYKVISIGFDLYHSKRILYFLISSSMKRTTKFHYHCPTFCTTKKEGKSNDKQLVLMQYNANSLIILGSLPNYIFQNHMFKLLLMPKQVHMKIFVNSNLNLIQSKPNSKAVIIVALYRFYCCLQNHQIILFYLIKSQLIFF